MVNKCSAGNENVPLALAAMHETTITAARYFLNRRDVVIVLEMFNTWCTISNYKKRYWKYTGINTGKYTGNAVINEDKKTVFL